MSKNQPIQKTMKVGHDTNAADQRNEELSEDLELVLKKCVTETQYSDSIQRIRVRNPDSSILCDEEDPPSNDSDVVIRSNRAFYDWGDNGNERSSIGSNCVPDFDIRNFVYGCQNPAWLQNFSSIKDGNFVISVNVSVEGTKEWRAVCGLTANKSNDSVAAEKDLNRHRYIECSNPHLDNVECSNPPQDKVNQEKPVGKRIPTEGSIPRGAKDITRFPPGRNLQTRRSGIRATSPKTVSVTDEEAKIRAELAREIEKGLELEIKQQISTLSRRLEELHAHQKSQSSIRHDMGNCSRAGKKSKPKFDWASTLRSTDTLESDKKSANSSSVKTNSVRSIFSDQTVSTKDERSKSEPRRRRRNSPSPKDDSNDNIAVFDINNSLRKSGGLLKKKACSGGTPGMTFANTANVQKVNKKLLGDVKNKLEISENRTPCSKPTRLRAPASPRSNRMWI
eukprot:Gb_06273 [translate_table: standard]